MVAGTGFPPAGLVGLWRCGSLSLRLTRVMGSPKQVDLSAKAIGIDTESFDVSRIAADLRKAKSKAEFLKATIEWLVAEGFIRAGSEPDHYIATFHCLKLNGCVPDALKK